MPAHCTRDFGSMHLVSEVAPFYILSINDIPFWHRTYHFEGSVIKTLMISIISRFEEACVGKVYFLGEITDGVAVFDNSRAHIDGLAFENEADAVFISGYLSEHPNLHRHTARWGDNPTAIQTISLNTLFGILTEGPTPQ